MIFVVEDDSSIRDIEIYTLKSTGFEAVGFTKGKELFSALKDNKPELIILDIMLPDEDGYAILKKLKSLNDTKDIPVIMATAKSMEYDKVQGLDLGADDYLVKPFGMMEMVSRVKAVLRRSKKSENVLKNGEIKINVDEHIVYINDIIIELTLKEYQLLKLFLTHIGMVFTREQLLNQVWGTEYYGETRTVDAHIRSLRKKIGDSSQCIETVRGVGYRMGAVK